MKYITLSSIKICAAKLSSLVLIIAIGVSNIGFAAPAAPTPEFGPNGIIIANNKVPDVGKSKGARPVPGQPGMFEGLDANGRGIGLYTNGPEALDTFTTANDNTDCLPISCVGYRTGHLTKWPCTDFNDTNVIEFLYAHTANQPSRLYNLKTTFDQYIQQVETVFNESALSSGGGQRRLKVRTNSACDMTVTDVTLSEEAINGADGNGSFIQLMNELKALGFNKRKYLVWVERNNTNSCGQASFESDSNKANNRNNNVPSFARVDLGSYNGTCLGSAEAHEIIHMLGGVQNDAPHASGAAHCYDENDRMCGNDGGPYFTNGGQLTQTCPHSFQEYRLDCNDDDYYDANPGTTGYTSLFFNVATDSKFLTNPGSVVTAGSTWYSDGTKTKTIASSVNGVLVKAYATGAIQGVPYKLYTARPSRDGSRRCVVDVMPINTNVVYAGPNGLIGTTSGLVARNPGTYDVCFYAIDAGTYTGAITLIVQ